MSLPRLRPEIHVEEKRTQSGTMYLVIDPRTSKSLTLSSPQYQLVCMLAKASSIEQMVVEARKLGLGITEAVVMRLIDGLRTKDLLSDTSVPIDAVPAATGGGWHAPERPRFRADLTIERVASGQTPVFRVTAPGAPTSAMLYELELQLARRMDGRHTLQALISSAQASGLPITAV